MRKALVQSSPSSSSIGNAYQSLPTRTAQGAESPNLRNEVGAKAKNDNEVMWQPPFLAHQAVIVDLIDVYFEVVYPMYVPDQSSRSAKMR